MTTLMSNEQPWWQRWGWDLIASVVFYTTIPLPNLQQLDFQRVAVWAPVLGLMIGGILGLVDWGLNVLGVPVLTRSALVVMVWLVLTGGLHLDGAMDTADGLAVLEPQRRLQVMADSHTGAFGAMAAIAIVLLKTTALTDLDSPHWLQLMAAAGWGRWGQQVAIAQYSNLKPDGKGAVHKTAIRSLFDVLPGFVLLLGLSASGIWLASQSWSLAVGIALGGGGIAVLTGAWFNQRLGGHTGDTYGAVVEWTEALFLCLLTAL